MDLSIGVDCEERPVKDLEPNKIFAAILVAGIVASLSGFVASKATQAPPLKANAFKIEGVATPDGAAPVEEKPQPVLGLIAAADPAKGQQIAKVCGACHVFDKGGPNGLGPNLYGVVGRPKGSHAGYDYSDGMKHKGGNWVYADLNKFLYKPKAYVDGTKMGFVGLKKPDERAEVIAWLRTLADSPLPEPTAAEIAAEQKDLAPPVTKTRAEPTVSTAPTLPAAAPVSGPAHGEIGTPAGKISGQPQKTTVKPLNGSNATSAVPEGNAGTGAPESSATVRTGSKPVANGAAQTPAEKTADKLPGQHTSQAKTPAKTLALPRPDHVVPVETDTTVEQNSGTKDRQQNGKDDSAQNPAPDLVQHQVQTPVQAPTPPADDPAD